MTYVLVPGAGGDASYWHRVVPLLELDGERVVAVELPTEDPEAGLAAYADAIVAATCDGAGDATDVTLVAQSMAAFSAPLSCDRLDVRRIVLVNAMVPRPGETPGDWWEATGQVAARREHETAEGRDPDAPFDVRECFFHDVPPEVTREAFARAEKGQADRPFGEPWPLAAWPDAPTAGVAGRDDRLFPVEFQRRVARQRIGVELDVLPGGHLLALSQPEALAAYLSG